MAMLIPFRSLFKEITLIRRINTSAHSNSKTINRQVKIMGKLLGQKVPGSKNRWYPTKENLPPSSSFVKAKNPGKATSRRINVLNKLFMRHITDLLATGEASADIVGKGLEISRVKVNPDFHGVNVYWVAKGTLQDYDMEAALNRCSGVLRHELSQLRLMGEVPKIRFVKDKFYANYNEVEGILQKCDFGDDHKKIDANQLMYDFAGYPEIDNLSQSKEKEDDDEPIPPMRHDVMGLDHKKIMEKILIKMKKSKKAWEIYENNVHITPESEEIKATSLEDVENKLKESKLKEEQFEKFLKRRRYAKNTPERKKDLKYYEQCVGGVLEEEIDYGNSKDDGDYIEEYEKDKL